MYWYVKRCMEFSNTTQQCADDVQHCSVDITVIQLIVLQKKKNCTKHLLLCYAVASISYCQAQNDFLIVCQKITHYICS